MAKYTGNSTDARFICRHCGGQHLVEMEQQSGAQGFNTTVTIVKACQCDLTPPPYRNNSQWLKPKAKEPEVTKTFDTTPSKSTALNAIQQRVEEIERALYNKVHALAKVEAEHTKLIADASLALNNAIAQAYQNGIEEEDLELHLPDNSEFLSERLIEVANDMSLANVLEMV